MTDDLIKRLRWRAESSAECLCGNAVCEEAADRIEELQSKVDTVRLAAKYAAKIRDDRIEKLEAALRDLSDGWECCPVSQAMRRVARKALEGKDDVD
jgi:hypothetical protein